jgi:hypothetical protein
MGTTPQTFTARQLAEILGRNQGPELFFQQPFATLTSPVIPKVINLNRPLERIHIVWRGRVQIATANFTTIASEAPQTIIQRIRLTGLHRRYGALAPIDISGATAFAYTRLFRLRTSSLYITTGGITTRQADPSVPFQQVGTTFGNIGTYDLEVHYDIPLIPILNVGSESEISTVPFLFQQADWQDTLQLQLFFGDATSFGTPGTAVTTFSAFGSGSGSPLVSIFSNYEILGPLANSVSPAVVVRNEQTITTVTSVANNVRLLLMQKQKTGNILIKSGTLLTGSSAGVSVFGALQDTMLDLTQVVVDNKPVRNNFNNFAQKEYAGYVFGTALPQGYLNFPFQDSMSPYTYFRGDLLAGGSTFEVDSNILTANANNAVGIIQEQVIGDPQ